MTKWLDELVDKDPNKIYIAHAGELEFQGASESDRAGRKVKLRLIRPPEDQGKVHPFAKFTRRRRGYTGTRFEVSFAEVNGRREFMLEAALDNWTDSPKGSMVSLALNMDAEHHPFMNATRASKDVRGTRYMTVFIEKHDDDSLVHQERQERAERVAKSGRSQTLSNVARMMTKYDRFHDWLAETVADKVWTTESADAWLKDDVGINSKAELDDERTPESAKKIIAFHKLRERFLQWQEAQGDDLVNR